MVDSLTLQRRLKKLEEYLQILKNLKSFKKTHFLEDPYLRGSAQRYLHLAIERMLDIGNHIISSSAFRSPEDYRSIFEILAENKIISIPFSRKLQKWAGFRNILVHDYLKINDSIIYQVLQKDLLDIKKFMKIFSKYAE